MSDPREPVVGAHPANGERSLPADDGDRGPATGEIQLPARFGKYVLLRQLATGGMAELFLALQRSVAGFEKLLVVKRILPHLARDETFIAMLLTEARIAATLNHPNVAHVYDVGVHRGSYFIAMEHVHGEDLRTIVRQMRRKEVERFPVEHAIAIGLGCCAGLAYAHEKADLDGQPMEIVHRDVSPQNVVVTFSGDVKLVDFGIAKAGRSRMEDTQAGRLKGKIPYMSPEQARGGELDARSDLFSLGIVLYELVTGRRLFKGKNEFDSLQMITEGDIPKPSELEPTVPPRLEAILLRMLARDPDARYPSARAIQADLEAFVREEQVAVSPLSLGHWMRALFAEELVAEEATLAEARQVAASLVEDDAELPSLLPDATPSRTSPPPPRPAPPSGVPRPAVAAVVLLAVVVAAVAALALRSAWRSRATDAPPASAASAPAPPAPPEARASLRIRTRPAGAAVAVDGRPAGAPTPTTVADLTPGARARVTLTRDGYETVEREVDLTDGANELEVELVPTPLAPGEAKLRVVVNPQDARASLDGVPLAGEGSERELRTRAGRARLVVRRPGYAPVERWVVLRDRQVEEVRVALELERLPPPGVAPEPGEALPGRLVFDATPWCEVTLDGRSIGQTPIVEDALSPGRHRLRCRNPELGVTRELAVDIAAGETTRLKLPLVAP